LHFVIIFAYFFHKKIDKTDKRWYYINMNEIAFADKISEFVAAGGSKYLRCLKVVLPSKGKGGSIVCQDGAVSYASSEYVIIPPYISFKCEKYDEEDAVVCVDRPLMPSALPVKVVRPQRRSMFQAVAEAVYYASEQPKDEAILSALGELIVSYCIRDYGVCLHPVVKSLKADIEKNFTDGTYSAEVSLRKLPLNYDYVRKLFKKQTGVSPREYLLNVRMQRAEALILHGISNSYSNFTVSQIAEACGFAEPLYFSRVFKQYFGVSPLQYARENGKR